MFPHPSKVGRPPHSASPMTPLRVPTTQHLQQQMLSRLYYDRLAYRHTTDLARGPNEMHRGTAYPSRRADPYYRAGYPYRGTDPRQVQIPPESYRHPLQTVGYRSGSGSRWYTMPGIVPLMPRPQLYQPHQTTANAERLPIGDAQIHDDTGHKNDLDAVTVLEVRTSNGTGSKNDMNARPQLYEPHQTIVNAERMSIGNVQIHNGTGHNNDLDAVLQQKETNTKILRTNPGSSDRIKENGLVKVMTVEGKAQKVLEDDPTDSTKNAPQKNCSDSQKQTSLAVSQSLGQDILIREGERVTTASNGPTVRKVSIEKVEQNLYSNERPTVSGLIPTNGIRQMHGTENTAVQKLLDRSFNEVNSTGNVRQPETNFYKLGPNTEAQKPPLSHAGKIAQKQLESLALEVRPRQKYPNLNSTPLPIGHISSMKRGVVHAFRQISPSKTKVVTSSSTILGLGIPTQILASSASGENRPMPPLSGVTSAIQNPAIRHQVRISAQDRHTYCRPPVNASTSTNLNAGFRPVVFPPAPGSQNCRTPLEIATVTPANQNNGVTYKVLVVTPIGQDSNSKPETVAKQSQNTGPKVSDHASMYNSRSPPPSSSPDVPPIVPVTPVATVHSASENISGKHPKPPPSELTTATPNCNSNNASKIVTTSSTLVNENATSIAVTQKCLAQDGLNLDQKSQIQLVINAPKAVTKISDLRPDTINNVNAINQNKPPAKSAVPSIIQKSPEMNMSAPASQKSQTQPVPVPVSCLEPEVPKTMVPASQDSELVETTLTSGSRKSPSKTTTNLRNTETENIVSKSTITTSPPVGLWKAACATSESVEQKPSSAPIVIHTAPVGQVSQSHLAITLSTPPSQRGSTGIQPGIFTPTPGFKSFKMQLNNINSSSGKCTLSAITYSIPSNPSSSLQTGISQAPQNRQNSIEQQRNTLSIQNDHNLLMQEQVNNYNSRMDTFRMQRERYFNSSTMSQNSQKQPGTSHQMYANQNGQMPRGFSDSMPISRSLQTQLGASYPMPSQQYQMQHAYMYPKSMSQNYQTQSRALYSTSASQYSQMQLGNPYSTPISQTARIQARINSQMETSQNFLTQPMITNQSAMTFNAGANIGAVNPTGNDNNNIEMQSGTINPIVVSQSSKMQAQNSRLMNENTQVQTEIMNSTLTSQNSQPGIINLTARSQNYGVQTQMNNPSAIIQNHEMQHGPTSHTASTRKTGIQPQMNNSTKTSQNCEPRMNNPTEMSPDSDIRMNDPTASSPNSQMQPQINNPAAINLNSQMQPQINNPAAIRQNSQMQPQINNPNVSSNNSQIQPSINNSAAKKQNSQMPPQNNNPAAIRQNSQMQPQVNNPNVSSHNSQMQPSIKNSAAKRQNSQMLPQINNPAAITISQNSQVQPTPTNRCESQQETQDTRGLTQNSGNQLDITPPTQINQNSGNLKRNAPQHGNNPTGDATTFKKPRKNAPRQKVQAQTQISTTQVKVNPSQSIPSAQNSATLHRNNTEIRDASGNQIPQQSGVTKPASNVVQTTVQNSYTSLSNRNDIDIEILDGGRRQSVVAKPASNVVPTTVQNSHLSLFDRIDGGGNRIPRQSVVTKPDPHVTPPTLRIGSSISLTPIQPLLTPKVETDNRSVGTTRNESRDDSPGRRLSSHVCDGCNRVFLSDATLCHHKKTRCKIQIYDCRLCPAQFRAEQDYRLHRQYYHKMAQGLEMAIPLVDLRDDGVKNSMAKLGVRNYIPLSQITCESNGHFGIPIMAADGESNALRELNSAGVSNVFSLGPIKELPR